MGRSWISSGIRRRGWNGCEQNVYHGRMSAIVWVYTPEGFVVGADGRRKDLVGHIGTDSAQKIFFFETSNTRGAFTWNGCTEISTSSSYFDFKDLTSSILKDIRAERF